MIPTVEMIEAWFRTRNGLTRLAVERIIAAALAAMPGPAVRAKPLEWCNGHPSTYMLVAESVLGLYMAWEINGTGVWSLGSLPGKLVDGGIEAAKAAAQADYEARILSALTPAPDLAAENERLRAALETIASLRDCGCTPFCQCNTQESLEVEVEALRDVALAALEERK